MRTIRLSNVLLLLGLVGFPAIPAVGQNVKNYFERNHFEGFVSNREHLKHAPEGGIINSDQLWHRIWSIWTRQEAPKVNFESNVVLLATAEGRNQPMFVFEWGDSGALDYRLAQTRREGTGFTYSMIRLPRAKVRSVNGRDLPPPPRVPVRHLDIPDQHPSYLFSNSFILRTAQEVDLYCTSRDGEWGYSCKDIQKALRISNIDFEQEQVVVVVVPQPDGEEPVVFGEPDETEHRVEIPITSPPANTSRTMLNRARGYIIPKVPGKDVFWTINGDLRIFRNASGDLAERTGAALRRLRLRLQSPVAGESIAAASQLAKMGPAANTAIPELIENLSRENHQVQTASADALRAMGPHLITYKHIFLAMKRGEHGNFYAQGWSKMMLDHVKYYEDNDFWREKSKQAKPTNPKATTTSTTAQPEGTP